MRALVIGSMNCMPTEYAVLLKKYYDEVIHYYDGRESDSLSNPLIRWGVKSKERLKGIVVRRVFFSHYLFFIFPKIFHLNLVWQLGQADLILLSGPSISLARLVKVAGGKKVIALSYGSDLSLFCNPQWPGMTGRKTSGLRGRIVLYLGSLKKLFLRLQTAGLKSCSHYSYFVEGIDPPTDAMLSQILAGAARPARLPRYSISLDILDDLAGPDPVPHLKDVYKILFPVRFCEDELLGNKGWRLLFDGLQKYRLMSKRAFRCICFRKGDHVEAAAYAEKLGIDDLIEWADVVPFDTLKQYYRSADVVVEQLGSHWIAQGLFVMVLGKPVIGRVATAKQAEFFRGSGLLEVSDVDSIVVQLMNCESAEYREAAGTLGRSFVPAKASIESEFLRWAVL